MSRNKIVKNIIIKKKKKERYHRKHLAFKLSDTWHLDSVEAQSYKTKYDINELGKLTGLADKKGTDKNWRQTGLSVLCGGHRLAMGCPLSPKGGVKLSHTEPGRGLEAGKGSKDRGSPGRGRASVWQLRRLLRRGLWHRGCGLESSAEHGCLNQRWCPRAPCSHGVSGLDL